MDIEITRCTWPGCSAESCAVVLCIKQRHVDRKEELCEVHGLEFVGRYRSELASPGEFERRSEFIRCELEIISGSEARALNIIRLRERGGKRHLTLESGGFEISALMWSVQGQAGTARSSHELMLALVKAARATIERIEIADAIQRDGLNVYRAQVVVSNFTSEIESVAARPSDSIHLAFLADAPVFVHESLLAPGA